MSSIIQTIQNRTFLPTSNSLPLSHTDPSDTSRLRRRLSSLNFQPISSPATSWTAFRRSKSVSAMGDYAGSSIRKWWDWSWGWVMSRKPVFAQDLEMNDDESSALGSHCRGSVKHLFYKIRSEIRKLVGSSSNVGLPQTYRYDSINYAKNFDDGRRS
ncbi:hypothetical protein QQ045_028562 [Rhodiola kirilowii]